MGAESRYFSNVRAATTDSTNSKTYKITKSTSPTTQDVASNYWAEILSPAPKGTSRGRADAPSWGYGAGLGARP